MLNAHPTSSPSTKLLIDTDPGIDDAMAILLALATPSAEVCSITLTHGNTSLVNVTRNLLSLFHVLDQQAQVTGKDRFAGSRPRVAVGSDIPMRGNLFTAEDFHGRDGMGSITTSHPHLTDPLWESRLESENPHPRYEASPLDAVDEIIHQLTTQQPNTLTILALGPLTNLAKVVEKDPKILFKAKEIVVMGGAIFSPGNISPLGEFNFYADPYAANVVLNATQGGLLPLTLVPLDITHTSFLHRDFVTKRLGSLQQPLAEMFFHMLGNGFKFTLETDGIDGIALHDPLAAAIAMGLVNPAIKTMAVHVEHTSALTYGACVVDRRFNPPLPLSAKDPHVKVCLTFPNNEQFQAMLLDTIFTPDLL